MRLADYLKSEHALVDVRALLKDRAKHPQEDFSVVNAGVRGKFGNWWLRPRGPWIEITLDFNDEDKCDIDKDEVRCFYRSDGASFVVSDCGETVSAMMRRTGKSWRDSLRFVHQVECELPLETDRDGDIKIDSAEDIAQASITVLSIIGNVREVSP